MRLFQYQAKVDPLQPLVTGAQPLSWMGRTEVPQSAWTRQKMVSVAAIAPSLFLTPLVNAPTLYQSSNTVITFPRTTQYQARAYVPLATAPPVTDAKYLTQYPDRINDVRRNQYLYPSFVVDAKQLTLKETNLLSKWLGYQPERINPIPRNSSLYPYFYFNGAPSTYNPIFPPNGNTGEPTTNWTATTSSSANWAGTANSTRFWAQDTELRSDKQYDSTTRAYDSTTITYDGTTTDTSGRANWTSVGL